MDSLKINGDVKTSDYFAEGNYCLLAKIKKAMFNKNNDVKVVFRLISNGTSYKKNDYYVSVHSSAFLFVSLDKRIDVKCHVRQDSNYLYVYTEQVEYGYHIVMQILSCTNLSLPHIELVHYGIFTNTLLGDTEITPTNYNTVTVITPSFQNSWVDNGFTYIYTEGDMVYVYLDIKSGTTTNYTNVLSGLPIRELSEPSGLRFIGLYKDTDNSYKGCYLNLSRSGDLQIQGGALNNNAELTCNFSYKRKFVW